MKRCCRLASECSECRLPNDWLWKENSKSEVFSFSYYVALSCLIYNLYDIALIFIKFTIDSIRCKPENLHSSVFRTVLILVFSSTFRCFPCHMLQLTIHFMSGSVLERWNCGARWWEIYHPCHEEFVRKQRSRKFRMKWVPMWIDCKCTNLSFQMLKFLLLFLGFDIHCLHWQWSIPLRSILWCKMLKSVISCIDIERPSSWCWIVSIWYQLTSKMLCSHWRRIVPNLLLDD